LWVRSKRRVLVRGGILGLGDYDLLASDVGVLGVATYPFFMISGMR